MRESFRRWPRWTGRLRGDRKPGRRFPWLLSPTGSPAVTPASVQPSPVFALPPARSLLLKGPPSFPGTRRDHTSGICKEETPSLSSLGPLGPALVVPREPLSPEAGERWRAASTTGLRASSLPPRTWMGINPGVAVALSSGPSGEHLLPPASGQLLPLLAGHASISKGPGTRHRTPCPDLVLSLPIRDVVATHCFVLYILMRSAISPGFSSSDYRLLKGFFRLSKNCHLVTVRHLPLLARGAHVCIREPGRCRAVWTFLSPEP